MNKPEFVRNGKLIAESNYLDWLGEIKHQIHEAQYEAMKAVNTTIIKLYWEIGRSIAEKQAEGWGKSVVEQLSKDIQIEFPEIKGFGSRNLWYMMQFYVEYQGDEKLQPLVAEISWAKHLVIMTKCKDSLERQFYILATKKFGWTKNVLIHQIGQKSKNRTVVEYALRNSMMPIGVATYSITSELPDDYKHLLPEADKISNRLQNLVIE